MQSSITASAIAAALVQFALESAIAIGVLTLIATPAMKYFARSIPILSSALVLFASGYTVLFVLTLGWVMLRAAGVEFPSTLSGITVFAGLFVVGWTVNRFAARNYGIATKFPSLGFKVMLSTLAGTWVLTGILYAVVFLAR